MNNLKKSGDLETKMEKICIMCGKPFTPTARHNSVQRTCGPECRKLYNNEKSRIRQQDPEFRAKKLKYYYDTHTTCCLICGKPIDRIFMEGKLVAKPRLHDECVYADCRNTLLCGKKLDHVQQLRLASKGYGVKEFVKETCAWRDEHMPMSACLDSMLSHIPQQFRLALDRAVYNCDTEQYEITIRTDRHNGRFKTKNLKFRSLQQMQRYFRDVRTFQKLSSNFQK